MPRALLVLLGCALLGLAACGGGGEDNGGGDELSGRVEADGSSTLAPFVTRAAERFRSQ